MNNREVVLLLLDSDAARKLCQFDLIEFLLTSIQFEATELGVLPQLRFQLHLNDEQKAEKKLGSRIAYQNAKSLVSSAFEVEVSAVSANPILNLDRPDLDTGELTLFAALSEKKESHLLSGDKRAYIALSKVDESDKIHELWPRFLCLEEAILIIIAHQDFDAVSERVRSDPDIDKAVTLTFGVSTPTSKEAVEAALTSYVNHLQKQTSGRFIPIADPSKALQLQ